VTGHRAVRRLAGEALPPRPITCFVGALVIALSLRTLLEHFGVAGIP